MRKNIKVKKKEYTLDTIEDTEEVLNQIFQSGGTYKIPVYQPFNYQFSPVKMNFNYGASDVVQTPQVNIPDIDFGDLDKLQGKGHTNDVNAYIQSKQAAQQELKSNIAKYGVEYAQLPEFGQLVNKMTVSPNELNELIVRREMSDDYAAINKENGGENEWVTDANGSIFVKDTDTQEYKYVSAYDININPKLIPVTSADAIQLNDRDPSLTKNSFVMPAVSQVWGGKKSLDHINAQMDKLGKTARESAREAMGQLGTIRGSDVFGTNSTSGSNSSNMTQLRTLAQSLMSAMDQGAMNYFKRQAIQQTGRVKTSPEEYDRLIQSKTQDLLWQYMSKAIDTSVSSKQSMTINSDLTKGIKGGAGYVPPNIQDLGQYFATGISIAEDDQGNLKVMDGMEKTRITYKDPITGKIVEGDAGNWNRINDPETLRRFGGDPGMSLANRQVEFLAGDKTSLNGGVATNVAPQLIQYMVNGPNGTRETRKVVKKTGLFMKSELEGKTFPLQVKQADGTIKIEEVPMLVGDELNPKVALATGAKTVIEDQTFGFGIMGKDEEDVEGILISTYGFKKDQAAAYKGKIDAALIGVNGLYEIPYFTSYDMYDVNDINNNKTAVSQHTADYEEIKVQRFQQNDNANWRGGVDATRTK